MNANLKGHIAMFGANAIWGLMSPVSKLIMTGGVISPLVMTDLRVGGAMLLFWFTSFFQKPEHVNHKDMITLFFASLFAIVLNQGCFIWGIHLSSPTDASIITTSMPLWAMILAAYILKEPITGKKVLGIACGAGGALLLILGSSSNAQNVSPAKNMAIWGDLLVLFAQFCYAFYIVFYKDFVNKYSLVTIMKWLFTYSFICVLPFSANDLMVTQWENLTLESEPNLLKLIGLIPLLGLSTNVVTLVQEESPAFRAGLQAQDRIVAVNGVETLNWQAVQKEISKAQGRIELYVVREGKEYRTELIPEFKCDKNNVCRNLIGVGTEFYPIDNLTLVKEYNFIEAVGKAASDTAQMSLLIARTTLMLLDGTISAQNISGPISIARGAGESASIGLIFFISFLAAVSVNLGILNLLPVPVLDGGQLLFLAYEAVVGRQPSAKVQTVLTALGISFLVSLSLFAIFNDIRAL